MKFFKLDNPIKNYAWGTKRFIPDLMNLPADRKPKAEMWMGAHPQASSLVINNDIETELYDLIKTHPNKFLGNELAKNFSNLPFLFKVLSSEKPLSIQAHPSKKQAEEGVERENKAGIPLNAYERNYKDDNHKPELICALTVFDAMCGFRPISQIKRNFKLLETGLPIIREFVQDNSDRAFKELFGKLMLLEQPLTRKLVNKILHLLPELQPNSALDELSIYWIEELQKYYPFDIGVLAPMYLNVVRLKKGEALYLPAGVLHSYLKGSGIEIMANSDNVLRGGLTPKHIDPAELIKTLVWKHEKVTKNLPVIEGNEAVYRTPAQEFELSKITLNGTIEITEASFPEIYLLMSGELTADREKIFRKGESFFIPAEVQNYEFSGNAELFRAKVAVRA